MRRYFFVLRAKISETYYVHGNHALDINGDLLGMADIEKVKQEFCESLRVELGLNVSSASVLVMFFGRMSGS